MVGINTLVLHGAQGIGFAIPIEAAYEEFTQLRRAASACCARGLRGAGLRVDSSFACVTQ